MANAESGEGLRPEDWAGERGEAWLANLDALEAMIADVGDALIEAARPRPGERVLDVGCGGGATTRRFASAVAPGGSVTGLDISPVLTREAESRAKAAGLANIGFVCADVVEAPLEPAAYNLITSRFGVMFFEDPVAAFANLRSAAREGGRLVFACWAPVQDNPWILDIQAVIAAHIEMPQPDPRAPGPFAFADTDYVAEILGKAGFSTPRFEPWSGTVAIGGPGASAQEATDFVFTTLSIGDAIKDLHADAQAAIRQGVLESFEPSAGEAGVIKSAKAWLVSAEAK